MRLISAKEIVKAFDISYQSVNSYTDLGLLDVVAKRSRLRLYDYAKVKKRLNDISRLINEGYTLRLIRKILNERKSR
jgi:DNA-binding transcriptional MerR regulator